MFLHERGITHKKLINPLCPKKGHCDAKGYVSSQKCCESVPYSYYLDNLHILSPGDHKMKFFSSVIFICHRNLFSSLLFLTLNLKEYLVITEMHVYMFTQF